MTFILQLSQLKTLIMHNNMAGLYTHVTVIKMDKPMFIIAQRPAVIDCKGSDGYEIAPPRS